MKSMKSVHIAVLCSVLTMTGCAANPANPMDPLEPMNRKIYTFNDKFDKAIAKPVAKAYRTVTPSPFRIAVDNFFDNIRDVYSLANNILSAEPEKAMNDLMRVAINSTLGVFGLVDFASATGLKSNKTNLGDTLAHWGWKNSSYLVIPFLGPSTIRDGTGTGITLWVSPDRQLYDGPAQANVAWGMELLSKRERVLGLEDAIDEAALDPYSYTRDAYMQIRTKEVGGTLPTTQSDDDLDIDQLVAPASAPLAVKPDASAAH